MMNIQALKMKKWKFLQILIHTPNFLPKIKEYYNKVNEDTLIYNLFYKILFMLL